MSLKKSHSQYEEELFQAELDYFPLERYNGAHIKILHECLNGHKWYVSPNQILKGSGCPNCSIVRRKTHEEYIQELASRNINYKPIERYETAKVKILHKCPKGHEWKVRPKDILDGQGCKICNNKGLYNKKFFLKNPEKASQIGCIYLLKLFVDKKPYCLKIGITSKLNVEERIKHFSNFDKKIIKYLNMPLENCYNLEQRILDECENYHTKKKFGGSKELLSLSSEQNIIEIIEKYGG